MKRLLIDIETTPNVVHAWGLFNQNVGLEQVVEPTRLLCFTAKWLGAKRAEFLSVQHNGHEAMVQRAWELMDEAECLIHYNGKAFDVPHLNREFLVAGLRPPSPYHQVDLLLVVRKQFQFPSNRLAYVLKALDKAPKESTGGHRLWVQCMAGDETAWARMRRYSRRDVTALEELYDVLLPWIPGHPSLVIGADRPACPSCGADQLQRRGYAATAVSRYQRYQCQGCGSWSRGSRRVEAATVRSCA